MDKSLEQSLTLWLKKQKSACGVYLNLTITLGAMTGIALVLQAYLLATILDGLIIQGLNTQAFYFEFIVFSLLVLLRALLAYGREWAGFMAGKALRETIRKAVLDKLVALGPAYIKGKPSGAWANILLEQVEDLHDFYAKYLPAMMLAGFIPLIILAAVIPVNWLGGLILLLSAPLIPLFMVLVGMGAAEANRKNFTALQQLNGHFMDSLKGLKTLVLFNRQSDEITKIAKVTDEVRSRTMSVLSLAFLSSAVLEFFAAISIALLAVYFGFSYLGHLEWGNFSLLQDNDKPMGLFAGLFVLLLAPEFYQPLKDMGTHYHAKAKAIGAAQALVELLEEKTGSDKETGSRKDVEVLPQTVPIKEGEAVKGMGLPQEAALDIKATALLVLSPQGKRLLGPVSFVLKSSQRLGVVGPSGAGKSTLIHLLLGFLPYEGSLMIGGLELRDWPLSEWRLRLAWLGQEPQLFHGSLLDNLQLGNPQLTASEAMVLLDKTNIGDFVRGHLQGLSLSVGELGESISVGQAQRIALARALSRSASWFMLDEPTASLDLESERAVMSALEKETAGKGVIMVTHKLSQLAGFEQILVLDKGLVLESGGYDELVAKGGLFTDLLGLAAPESEAEL
jgi:ATP-binding cassette subfamily C protein CydD